MGVDFVITFTSDKNGFLFEIKPPDEEDRREAGGDGNTNTDSGEGGSDGESEDGENQNELEANLTAFSSAINFYFYLGGGGDERDEGYDFRVSNTNTNYNSTLPTNIKTLPTFELNGVGDTLQYMNKIDKNKTDKNFFDYSEHDEILKFAQAG